MNCEICAVCGRECGEDSGACRKYASSSGADDCRANAVDWRAERTARLAAEALVTASQAAQVTQTQARIEAEERAGRLEAALGVGTAWPAGDVLTRLADAADHLLGSHSCDAHGYEGVTYARDAARRIAVALTRNAAERGEAAAEPGREAEELRAGIEAIVDGPSGTESVRGALQALLDRVDARDSLAFLEKHSDRTRDAALEEAARACEAHQERMRKLAAWFDRRANGLEEITDGPRTTARAKVLRESAAYIRAALAGREITTNSDDVQAEFGATPAKETP